MRGMREGRLDSWKEIAAYLKRDVRTPVHRHQHDQLASIYAFAAEIGSKRR
jgi:hypothetical protein